MNLNTKFIIGLLAAVLCSSYAHGRSPQASTDMSLWAAKAAAISAPRVTYPYEARANGITGSGSYLMKIDPRTGLVSSVTILISSGKRILDNAALTTLKRWRFRPETVTKVRIPVTWSLP